MKVHGFVASVFALAATFGFASSNAFAAALSSRETLEVKVDSSRLGDDAKILWERFGEFCQIAEWQPTLFSCNELKEDGAVMRYLSLKDGSKIKEKMLSAGPTSYHYALVDGPLPVKNYEADFSLVPHKEALEIVWSASYDPADGKSEGDARAAIDRLFRDGIASIKSKLPNM